MTLDTLESKKKKKHMWYVPHKRQLKTKRKKKKSKGSEQIQRHKSALSVYGSSMNISIMKSFPDNLIFFKNVKPAFILHWSVSCVH